MNYEQMYKDALERARSIRFGNPNSATANVVCEDIFPELKESEDERIRRELIFYFGDMPEDTELRNGVTNRDALVWLEKQDSNIDNANKEYWRGYREGKQEILDKYAELEKQTEQKSTEWSEEDETKLKSACILLKNTSLKGNEGIVESTIDWLKSLKDRVQPQNRRKPSEAQISFLEL